MIDTFYSHYYLNILLFRIVFEKGHTIRHCSTKLHTYMYDVDDAKSKDDHKLSLVC